MKIGSLAIGEFARHVMTLMTGTILAQATLILVSPLLTRLYSPAEFGIFAIYTSLVAVFTVAATGRYELALNLPRSDLVAVHLIVLSVLWLGVFFLSAAAIALLAIFAVSPRTFDWIYALLPGSIALSGLVQILNYWLNRHKLYREIAISRALQSAGFAVTGILCGLAFRPEGMVLGFIAGQIACFSYLAIRSWPALKKYREHIRRSMALRTATRFRNFPRVLIFAHSLNTISFRLPILIMPISFGATTAGLYSLTQQVITLPMQIVGGAIGDVFRQQASVEFRETGSCLSIYLRTLKSLTALYALPFAVLVLLSPMLFAFIFGEQWRRAGVMAQILAPMFYIQFVSSPLSSMFMIAERQREDLIWQTALLVLTGSSLALGWFLGSIEICVVLFSSSYSIMYLVSLAMTYRFARGSRVHIKTLRPRA